MTDIGESMHDKGESREEGKLDFRRLYFRPGMEEEKEAQEGKFCVRPPGPGPGPGPSLLSYTRVKTPS